MSTSTPGKTSETRLNEPENSMAPPENSFGFALTEFLLRFLLSASCLVAVLVMAISEQTVFFALPFLPIEVSRPAKFIDSPAFIYFVAAYSVAGFYGIVTTLISFFALFKSGCCQRVLSHLLILDALLLGIVASATGAAGGVAYIGLKGNSKVQWRKICNEYDRFCRHVGASLAVSLFGSIVLALLVILSVRSLFKKIPS